MSVRWEGPRCHYCGAALRSGRVCRACSDLPPLDPFALVRIPTPGWVSPAATPPEAPVDELEAMRTKDRRAS